MKNVFTKEAKIGLVSIISLALLYIGINFLKGINLFQPTNFYHVAFTNVKDVTVSSPVFVKDSKWVWFATSSMTTALPTRSLY